VDFSYSSNRFQRELVSAAAMKKAFGQRAGPLMRRLAVLAEARTLADVPAGPPDRCHPLKHERRGQFAVTIHGNWRLVFQPSNEPLPKDEDGNLDLSQVTEVELIEVVDYHGN
jgi:proteic killer suppression protein